MLIEVGNEYQLQREGGNVAVKVVDYKPGHWVSYHPARNSVVRGSCTPEYFLERATTLQPIT